MLTGMGLQFNGRQVPGFGVAASDPEDGGCGHLLLPRFGVGASADVGSVIAPLQAAIERYGGPGIDAHSRTVTSGGTPGGAVAALQSAGSVAVSAGSAIDALSNNDPDVMKMTHSVWETNKKLASVNSSSTATQSDVDTAVGIIHQMIDLYQQAPRLAAKTAGSAPSRSASAPRSSGSSPSTPPATAPAAPPADDTVPVTSPWTWVAVGAGVLVLVVGGVAVAARRRAA